MPTPSELEIAEAPHWLNKYYLQKALQAYHDDETLKVLKFEALPASAKGDNYVCIMSRVKVQYKSRICDGVQSRSYVLKAALDSEQNSEVKAAFDSYGVYNHEMEMYGKVFPELRIILLAAGYDEDMFPKTLKIDEEHQSILFEDLLVRGFTMPDFRKGLNATHVKMILQKLAKMHAASAVANAINPGIYQKYNRGIMNNHSRAFDSFFNLNFKECARKVRSWEGYEVYGEKMLKLAPHFIKYGVEAMQPKRHHFNVLTHGDLWSNNTMFRYNDDNEPIDVILLDFQFSSWASPTTDLHYFLNTSLVEELRLNCLEDFVYFYYQHLTRVLQEMKYPGKIPTLHQFWIEYMETAFYALFTLTISQPLLMNEETADASINCLLKDDERARKVRNAIYSNATTQRNLKKLLPIFNKRGLLDLVK